MAQDINVVVLTGRLTRDAELKQLASGQYVANLSLANNKGRKKQGDQWVDQPPNFFNITVWGRTAEALKPYLLKGKQIAVRGRLQQRSYQVQGEARKRTVVDVVADDVQLLGGGSRAGGSATGYQSPAAPAAASDVPAEFGGAPEAAPADPFEPDAAPQGSDQAPDDEIPF